MSAPSVYVDSNVFIVPVLYSSAKATKDAKRILGYIESGSLVAYTSTMTWDEVVWVVSKTLGKSDARNVGKNLLAFPNLRYVPFTEELLGRAQTLVDEFGVAPRDAIHCASAIGRKAETVISEDSDLDAVRGIKRVSPSAFKLGG